MTELITEVENIVGPKGVIVGDSVKSRAASATDSSSSLALAIIRPQTTQELSKIMALCHKRGQRIVIQGGMSGLVNGGRANQNELAVSLERMIGIEQIDPAGKTMTVRAGTIIQNVHEKAAEHELIFPVDWGARGSAMVGGAIATNAGGNSVLRYGMMRDQVLGLEAVLPDGTILSSMNRLLKNNTGYDLKQLFIGSEGTLGIVTRAVLRLHPAPVSYQTALLAVKTFDDVTAILGRLQSGLGGTLSAFEVMWQEHYEMVVQEGGHQWVLPAGYPYYIIAESTGGNETLDSEQFNKVLMAAMESELMTDAVICTSEQQRASLWDIREDVDAFFRVLDPPITFDVSVPITHMEDYVNQVKADMAASIPDARGTTFGHIGDGNIHFCWTVGTDDPEAQARVSQIVYKHLKPFNGSVSAEHGIGQAKRKYLNYSRNTQEILWMEKLKTLFDPKNILNPGRIVDVQTD